MIHIGLSSNKRPAGFGNEVFVIAKCLIGDSIIPGEILLPNYSSSRHDYPNFVKKYANHGFQPDSFNLSLSYMTPKKDYLILGNDVFSKFGNEINGFDYSKLILDALATLGTPTVGIIHASGMIGKYLGIKAARPMLQNFLKISKPRKGDKINLGLHFRGPDRHTPRSLLLRNQNAFKVQDEIPRPGVWNTGLPIWFYKKVLRLSQIESKTPINVRIYSNLKESHAAIRDLKLHCNDLRLESSVAEQDINTTLSELASSDIILPSISSFSMLAIFLGEARYIWPIQSLSFKNGTYGIWDDNETEISIINNKTKSQFPELVNPTTIRGFPINFESTESYSHWLNAQFKADIFSDLIYFGRLPEHFNLQS